MKLGVLRFSSDSDSTLGALFDITERLRREAMSNPAIAVEEAADKTSVRVNGRGEL